MYYGYNDNKELILADEEFINILGFSSFDEVITNKIPQKIQLDNRKLNIPLDGKIVEANYTESNLLTTVGPIKLVKLSNVIEISTAINNLQINYQPIYLDVQKISQAIGLSVDDYKLYLDSFIDQSIIDEKRLQEGDEMAIKNLSNLASTLQIPNISILLLKIKKLPRSERLPFVDEYYTKLALLTLKKPIQQSLDSDKVEASNLLEEDSQAQHEEELNSRFTDLLHTVEKSVTEENITKEKEPVLQRQENLPNKEEEFTLNLDDELELDLDAPKPKPKPTVANDAFDENEIFDLEQKIDEPLGELTLDDDFSDALVTPSTESKSKKINLDNVPALPINYNPKVAADELNLPVVLIEEFVQDFIEQAHHDKDHLLASYYQKDMDNIHELGHKLKGAASNLRINELADVLEEIQFCTDHGKLEGLFTQFWGLFLSLEDYMKQNAA